MHITKPRTMPHASATFKTAAIISSIMVLPFIILELINRRDTYTGFPVVLFAFLWLLSLAFATAFMSVVRSVPAGNQSLRNRSSLLLRAGLLFLIAWLWIIVVTDQMPCFLGVPNCD